MPTRGKSKSLILVQRSCINNTTILGFDGGRSFHTAYDNIVARVDTICKNFDENSKNFH